MKSHHLNVGVRIFLVAVVVAICAYFLRIPFSAPRTPSEVVSVEEQAEPSVVEENVYQETEEVVYARFIVPRGASLGSVADDLTEEDFIKNTLAFKIAFVSQGGGSIVPGAYKLSRTMDAFAVAAVLRGQPYMEWVVIPEGLRKEEVGELFVQRFGWTDDEYAAWMEAYSDREDYVEGVYFPDTYLISHDATPQEVAERLVTTFNERFGPYLTRFTNKNIRWTTGLTLASLVQREAAGSADMPLIAGILWNRLEEDMYLNVDATLQYMRGDTGDGWWAPIDVAEKQEDSPFNTYMYRGLPPHPIASPGTNAIEAVLEPEETDCIYYLHDSAGDIYCSVTYEEHKENIEEHLVE